MLLINLLRLPLTLILLTLNADFKYYQKISPCNKRTFCKHIMPVQHSPSLLVCSHLSQVSKYSFIYALHKFRKYSCFKYSELRKILEVKHYFKIVFSASFFYIVQNLDKGKIIRQNYFFQAFIFCQHFLKLYKKQS